MRKFSVILMLAVSVLSACATTQTLNVWKEKDTNNLKLSNVLIIGVARDASYQRMFENLMVDQLSNLDVKSAASYQLFPEVKKLDKPAVQALISQYGFDGVVVTRMIDRKKETIHRPATTYVSGSYYRGYPYATSYNRSNTWYGYYNNSYQVTYSPAYSVDYDITTAETNIYDAESERLVWSAMTETAETSKANAVRSFMAEMKKQLPKSGLF